MRIRRLTVAGFRGFNSPRAVEFHDRLTVLSAANSYGKTSITEALEFLLYGQTSKVEFADSRDEYKDSYFNRHYSLEQPAFVEAVFDDDGSSATLRVEIDADGNHRQLYNGREVTSWPFVDDMVTAARPFVVQHALKALLLAAPTERFQGFARLLGLSDIDVVQQALVNLCTKPEAHVPSQAKVLLNDLELFTRRLKSIPATVAIARDLDRGNLSVESAFGRLLQRAHSLTGRQSAEDEAYQDMIALRNAAAARVFKGSVAIKLLDSQERKQASAALEVLATGVDLSLVEGYARLVQGDTTDRLRRLAKLLGLGIDLLVDEPNRCPLCEQAVSARTRADVKDRHESLKASLGNAPDLGTLRSELLTRLKRLDEARRTNTALLASRCTDIIAASSREVSQKLKALIAKGNEDALFVIASGSAAVTPAHRALIEADAAVKRTIEVCEDSISRKAEDDAHLTALHQAITAYLRAVEVYDEKIDEVAPTLAEPSRLLREAVDAQAGTEELSLLIEILHRKRDIQCAVRIREMLDSLKELKKQVAQAVGETMEAAFEKDLTGAVMTWYQRIRTTSDPDVHFSGFGMERTKQGDFKSRRVKVSAHSYGVELASAVSSLSESKLNALGLCMSIATAQRAPGPWDFLILDDPIQSWDDEHEIQFINIIRELAANEGKQIILLSHRERWIDQVSDGCRVINGYRYHIKGYTKDGPLIEVKDWATVDQRLREMLAIARNPQATAVQLQQAEEEVRIVACQLAARASRELLGRPASGHNFNADKVRMILTEANCPPQLIDRVFATFSTTDPAHHAAKDYAPSAERVRQYHGTLTDIRNWMDALDKR